MEEDCAEAGVLPTLRRACCGIVVEVEVALTALGESGEMIVSC